MFKSRSTTQKIPPNGTDSQFPNCIFHEAETIDVFFTSHSSSYYYYILLHPQDIRYIFRQSHTTTLRAVSRKWPQSIMLHALSILFDVWQKLFHVKSKYKLGFATLGFNCQSWFSNQKIRGGALSENIDMCSSSNCADWKNYIKDEFPFCFGHLRLGSCSDTIFPPPSRHVV